MSDDFNDDFDPKYEEVKPVAGKAPQPDQVHRMRLSIDIHTIKEQDFRGSVYAKYTSYPQLNVSHFKTSPVVELPNARVEGSFKNSFKSYTFEADKNKLYENFNNSNFEIELWHQDRLSKDILIGVTQVNLNAILKAPLRKTTTSYARVQDEFLPIDEIDEYRKPIKKIGLLRVILYLEDLGPEELLKKREQELGINTKKQNQQQPDQHVITLPSQKIEHMDDPEKNRVLNEMNSLEYKIIWELETWKKAEESKFKITLKQKEMEFLQELNEKYKQKDHEKQKYFKQAEASIILLEKKLRDKAQELNRREQKIVQTEDELRTRIQETARVASTKDDEILQVKKKMRDDKGNFEKEKTALQMQLDTANVNLKKLQTEFDQFKKDQNNSPVTLVKNELESKLKKIQELQTELKKEHEIREQYKVYYEKMRGELVKQKKIHEDFKNQANSKQNDIILELKEQIENMKQQNTQQAFFQQTQQSQNQQYNHNPGQPSRQRQNNQYEQSQKYNNHYNVQIEENNDNDNSLHDYPEYQWDKSDMNEIERLIQERDYLLQTGDYQQNDPLILELNNQIADLQQL